MTAEVWLPLSAREANGESSLREGVPEALEEPLRGWISHVLQHRDEDAKRVQLRLDLTGQITPTDGSVSATALFLAYDIPVERLLDIVDCTLGLLLTVPEDRSNGFWQTMYEYHVEDQARRKQLQQLLEDARSVYQVKRGGKGLERRVDPIAAAMLESAVGAAVAMADAGSAAAQLQDAGDAVRALKPEPDKAYGKAIKAVESAAHVVIESNNARATLGTMIKVMSAKPDKFVLAIPGKNGNRDVAPSSP